MVNIDIKIKDEANAQLNALYNDDAVMARCRSALSLKNFVSSQPFFWGTTLTTEPVTLTGTPGALDSSTVRIPGRTYTGLC